MDYYLTNSALFLLCTLSIVSEGTYYNSVMSPLARHDSFLSVWLYSPWSCVCFQLFKYFYGLIHCAKSCSSLLWPRCTDKSWFFFFFLVFIWHWLFFISSRGYVYPAVWETAALEIMCRSKWDMNLQQRHLYINNSKHCIF